MLDKRMTLEKRIAAELYSYQGRMSVFVDDLHGNTVQIGADETFETASTIKAYILAVLYLHAAQGKADLDAMIEYKPEHFVDGSGMLRALGVGAQLRVRDTATMMIICSDNIATNMIIDYLGVDEINRCIHEDLQCPDTVLHNPLHFDRYDKLGTTTPRDYAGLFARLARGELVSQEASAAMLQIFRQQHYNNMLTHDFPQYYLDCEETGEEELIWVASKSGSMNACRNDGGIVHTPYGNYVIVLMNKDFHDIIEYNDHPAMVYGARVSRMILDQILACEGKLYPEQK
jgi:beta-lactamase class A